VDYFEYKEKIKHYDIYQAYMKRRETAKGINLGQLHTDIVLNISDRSMISILEQDTSANLEMTTCLLVDLRGVC
jgi:hypothetical protein